MRCTLPVINIRFLTILRHIVQLQSINLWPKVYRSCPSRFRDTCECLNCHTDTILSHKSQAKLNTYILCNTWCFSVQLSLKYKEQMDMFCATHLLPFSFLVCAHAHIILGASEPWELNWLHFKGRKRCLHYFISLYASIERREALLESRFYDQRDVGVTKKGPDIKWHRF